MKNKLFLMASLVSLLAVATEQVPTIISDQTGKAVCHSQAVTLPSGVFNANLCVVAGLFSHHQYYVEIDSKRIVGGIDDQVALGVSTTYRGADLKFQCRPIVKSPENISEDSVNAVQKMMPKLSKDEARKMAIAMEMVEVGRDCVLQHEDALELLRVKVVHE